MAQSHRQDEWGRLSCLMALVASVGSGKKRNPSEFNPYAPKSARSSGAIRVNLADLRGVFFPGGAEKPGLVGGGSTPVSAGQFLKS